jgi:hypothetical protein
MPTSASAAVANCGPTASHNYHVGYATGVQNYVEGSYAVISTQRGALCTSITNSSNFSAQYSMISSGNGAGWAQDGYESYYGGSIYYFGQVNSGAHMDTRIGTSPMVIGSTHYYYNKWVTTCQCEEEIIDRSLWQSTTWNPWSAWPQPFLPSYTGETEYAGSDVSGTPTVPVTYTNLGQQSDSTDGWGLVPCGELTSVNDVSTPRSAGKSWHDPITACPSFNVYTG